MAPKRKRSSARANDQTCDGNSNTENTDDTNKILQLLHSLTNKMEERFDSLTNKNEERFDSLTKECECLRRENIEILSAIDRIESKIEQIYDPSPIWKLITDYSDVFEKHVLTKLNGSDIKFFYGTNTDTRLAIKRAKIELQNEFKIEEMSSISQLEFAWDNYNWDEDEEYSTQEWFCVKVAEMNKLEYLVWAREVKNCDWDRWTIRAAAYQGNLAIVKYCVENGCPMDEGACDWAAGEGHLDVLKYLHENDCPWDWEACSLAHSNNHDDCLNYLIEQKCEGFERYLPPAAAAQAVAQ
jgi:hypothetical protein